MCVLFCLLSLHHNSSALKVTSQKSTPSTGWIDRFDKQPWIRHFCLSITAGCPLLRWLPKNLRSPQVARKRCAGKSPPTTHLPYDLLCIDHRAPAEETAPRPCNSSTTNTHASFTTNRMDLLAAFQRSAAVDRLSLAWTDLKTGIS